MLDGTLLHTLDGEPSCKASKSIAKIHKKVFGSSIPLNKGFGRRIDLILATEDEELSTSEWKRLKVSTRKSLVQQAKNIRIKAILSYLLGLPIDDELVDNVFTVGMDFTGPMGYMFVVKRVEDVYVSRHLSTLVMPTYLHELPSFIDTLDRLYAWRHHHIHLQDIVLPAIRKRNQRDPGSQECAKWYIFAWSRPSIRNDQTYYLFRAIFQSCANCNLGLCAIYFPLLCQNKKRTRFISTTLPNFSTMAQICQGSSIWIAQPHDIHFWEMRI